MKGKASKKELELDLAPAEVNNAIILQFNLHRLMRHRLDHRNLLS